MSRWTRICAPWGAHARHCAPSRSGRQRPCPSRASKNLTPATGRFWKPWDADGGWRSTRVARTNVAPAIDPPDEPSLYSFAYATPAAHAPLSFVVAGAGDLPDGLFDPADVVRSGETSADAMADKARFVMGLVEERLNGLWRHLGPGHCDEHLYGARRQRVDGCRDPSTAGPRRGARRYMVVQPPAHRADRV